MDEPTSSISISKQLLTVNDLGKIYSLGRTRIYELIKSGDLKARRIGRRTLFDVRDIEEWRNNLPLVRLGDWNG